MAPSTLFESATDAAANSQRNRKALEKRQIRSFHDGSTITSIVVKPSPASRAAASVPAAVIAGLFLIFAFGGSSSESPLTASGGMRAGARIMAVESSPPASPPSNYTHLVDKVGATDVFMTMHTFFDPVHPSQQRAKIDEADGRAQLEVWKESWEAMGWKTKVLTLADAKRHPHYEELNRALDGVPLDGHGGTKHYNRLCYMRWLAMAAAGGGWMGDYDTVPLKPPPGLDEIIPFSRRFTVFEGGVPSLLYGTAVGWDRTAKLLIQSGQNHAGSDIKLWSDMMALMELGMERLADGTTGRHFDVRNDVIEGRHVLNGRIWSREDCNKITAGKRAVHFSHNAMKLGKLKEGQGVADRPQVIKDWVKMYRDRCHGNKIS